ncbi:hypothetical protein BCR44DRAFT_1195784 [Catenaria anguillulae PL171]|uniref:Uncharacterized protein n=1 Tax=Catenaria anguillulae PL171 TaxID=765915 RepID=A0A1Y2HGN6_9FUNG|nr:hypothetical protein BCR44DRAFT_1195784 [Catenaria anguillulae PL171]
MLAVMTGPLLDIASRSSLCHAKSRVLSKQIPNWMRFARGRNSRPSSHENVNLNLIIIAVPNDASDAGQVQVVVVLTPATIIHRDQEGGASIPIVASSKSAEHKDPHEIATSVTSAVENDGVDQARDLRTKSKRKRPMGRGRSSVLGRGDIAAGPD